MCDFRLILVFKVIIAFYMLLKVVNIGMVLDAHDELQKFSYNFKIIGVKMCEYSTHIFLCDEETRRVF